MKLLATTVIALTALLSNAYADEASCIKIVDAALKEKGLGSFNKPAQKKTTTPHAKDDDKQKVMSEFLNNEESAVKDLTSCFLAEQIYDYNERPSDFNFDPDLSAKLNKYFHDHKKDLDDCNTTWTSLQHVKRQKGAVSRSQLNSEDKDIRMKQLDGEKKQLQFKEKTCDMIYHQFSENEHKQIAKETLGTSCDPLNEEGDGHKYTDLLEDRYVSKLYKTRLLKDTMSQVAPDKSEVIAFDKNNNFIVVKNAVTDHITGFGIGDGTVSQVFNLTDDCKIKSASIYRDGSFYTELKLKEYCENKLELKDLCEGDNQYLWVGARESTNRPRDPEKTSRTGQ